LRISTRLLFRAGQLVTSVKGQARDALGDLAYEVAYAEGLVAD